MTAGDLTRPLLSAVAARGWREMQARATRPTPATRSPSATAGPGGALTRGSAWRNRTVAWKAGDW